MSQSGGDPTASAGAEKQVSSKSFNLQVVSPSAGVSGPLSFSNLPTGTTVKQLKGKIRESLLVQPPDDHQRLIHRGRLLSRDAETMSDIFGQETLKASDMQTIHLVLRPVENSSSQTTATPPLVQGNHPPARPVEPFRFAIPPPPPVPPELFRIANEQHERTHHEESNAQPSNQDPRIIRFPTPPVFTPPVMPSLPSLGQRINEQATPNQQINHTLQPQGREQPQIPVGPTPPQFIPPPSMNETVQRQHGHPHHPQQPLEMIQLLIQQLQQDQARVHQLNQQPQFLTGSRIIPGPGEPPARPSFQDVIGQNQRERAAMGMQGAQNASTNAPLQGGQPGQFQNQYTQSLHRPRHSRTTTRDVTGPNGEIWQVTVNETLMFYPNHGQTPQSQHSSETSRTEIAQNANQNIARAVDSSAGLRQPSQLLRESQASSNFRPTAEFNAPTNRSANAPLSNTATPVSEAAAVPPARAENVAPPLNASWNAPNQGGPRVYILSSPTGPRALLVSPTDSGMEAFYTPRVRPNAIPQNPNPQARNEAQQAALAAVELRNNRPEARAHHHVRRQVDAAGRPVPRLAHPANRPAAAVVVQLWPNIWLIARLLGFVWFFTSGNNSWWRTIMVTGLAIIFFIVSTGIFNGIAEQVWAPFRRHLEGLLPLAAPNGIHPAIPDNNLGAPANPNVEAPAQGQVGGAANVGVGSGPRVGSLPNPAEAAVRLVEQRRQANENWIWIQIRRAEHAMILFLASLIPGVGERHIAARAAEENLAMEAQRQRREAETAAERANSAAAVADDAAGAQAEQTLAEVSEDGEGTVAERNHVGDENGNEDRDNIDTVSRARAQAENEEAQMQPLIQL